MKHYLRLCTPLALALMLTVPALGGNAAAAKFDAVNTSPRTPSPTLAYRTGTVILKLTRLVPNDRGTVQFGITELDRVLETLGINARQPLFPLVPHTPQPVQPSIKHTDDYGFDRVYTITFTAPFDARHASDMIAATGAVEFAEPYYIFPILYTPSDPTIGQQYWIDRIDARRAWDVTKGDSAISIGICDTGVDWTHEDLAENIYQNPGETGLDGSGNDKRNNGIDDDNNGYVDDYHGWDMVGNPNLSELQNRQYHPDNNPAPRAVVISGYEGYHGTAVGGCASARTDNGKGIAAPGFYTKILPLKCTADSLATTQILAGYEGIRYAADMGAKVINCSWGGPSTDPPQGMQIVIDYAYSKGALVVASSGNGGTNNDVTPSYPADLKHVVSVGATTNLDSAAGFAQYGASVDVWAPGVDTRTTMPGNSYQATNISGTSFSSPIVAGIAALVFSVHPDWDPDQVAMQLRVTGDRVNVQNPQFGPYFYRRVNAYRAVSINTDLGSGDTNNFPGLGLISYTINGKATDTIKSMDDVVSIELTMRNYLAPTRNLRIDAFPNQTLTLVQPAIIPTVGTLQTITQNVDVQLNPDAAVLLSEGSVQLILRLTDGAFEDLVTVKIPIYLPGWHQQVNPIATLTPIYLGGGIKAVTPTMAWAVSNIQASQTSQTPIFARTLDGKTWTSFQQAPTTEPFYCVTALDAQRAWAGTGPTSTLASVMRTINGGSTWLRSNVSSITPFVNAVHFFDDQNGIFLGDPLSGKWGIATTSDAGATWTALPTPVVPLSGTEAGWNNSFAAVGDNLWFGTNSARIYHSTNRGLTWTSAPTPTVSSFGVAFANANDGLATFAPATNFGGIYMVAASRDGGASWQQAPLPFIGAEPQGVVFVPGTTRAFVGTQNGVFETSDFGQSWKQMAMPSMYFVNMYISTAVDTSGNLGAYGTTSYSQLMTYKEQGTIPTNSVHEVATSGAAELVTLRQNIPNPASGITTIGFDLHRAAHVELSLYDALGLRVAVLASGAMSAGDHSINLDTDSLPSGTYFYTLVVNGERVTRQLVVLGGRR